MTNRWIILIFSFFALAPTVPYQMEQLIWTENFETASPFWRQSNNAEEIFLIQNGKYMLWRKNTSSPSLILPENGDLYSDALVELSVLLDKNQSASSAGLVALAQQDGGGAYILEINSRQEFRVRKITGSLFTELSGTSKSNGWVKNKAVAQAGELNKLGFMLESNTARFFVNDQEVHSLEEYQLKKGKCGVYVGPDSKAEMDNLKVFVSEEEAKRIKDDRDKNDPARSALTDVIITLRKTINNQNREIDSLQKLTVKLKNEQEKFDQSPKNVKKLTAEIAALKKDNAAMQAKLTKLEKENADLLKFKQNIQKNQGGDIVIQLSNALSAEKDNNAKLKADVKELNKKIAELEAQLKEK